MFDSSKDILYIVLSFCILWVTVFLCWLLYYAGKVLKDADRVVEEFRMRLQLLTDAINYIRGKVEGISSLMTLATQGAGGLVKKFVSKKAGEWMNSAEDKFDSSAKDAVDKAAAAMSKGMKRAAKVVKK